jgi:hypothetical protein
MASFTGAHCQRARAGRTRGILNINGTLSPYGYRMILLLAQLVAVTVFNSAGAEVSTAQVQFECGLYPKFVEVLPIVNPVEFYIDDPADQSKDCRALVGSWVSSLPPGTGYRMADLMRDGTYADLSSPFAVTSQYPPEPVPDPTCSYQGREYPVGSVVQVRHGVSMAGWRFQRSNKQWQWYVCE